MQISPQIGWSSGIDCVTGFPQPSGTFTTTLSFGNEALAPVGEALYLFLDESGDFDFGKNGSKFFFMTCVAAKRPFEVVAPMNELKYDALENDVVLEKFHACEDNNHVKTGLYAIISEWSDKINAYSIRVDKSSVPTEMRDPSILYYKMFGWITEEVYGREADTSIKKVIVITDSLPQVAKKKMVERPLRLFMKERFQNNGIPYQLLHHASCGWMYLQLTDYLSWAIQRWYTKGDSWPLDKVEKAIRETGEVRFDKNEGDPKEEPPTPTSRLSI